MKVYKENLIDVLTQLGIALPDRIAMDQKQITRLIAAIETALDTYDPMPPGDALVTDVRAGKIFSTAAGLGLTGTLTLADLTADADATDADILDGKTAYVNGALVTGALQFTPLPAPSVNVTDDLVAVVAGAAMYEDYFERIELYDGSDNSFIGEATYDAIYGYSYDLTSFFTEGGAYTIKAKYVADTDVTLKDSEMSALAVNVYDVTRTFTGCVDSNMQDVAIENGAFSGTISLLEGFTTLPATITITVDEIPLTLSTDFTYSNTTGEYTINKNIIDGDVVIIAVATV